MAANRHKSICVILIAAFFLMQVPSPSFSFAEDVYRYVSDTGEVYYSTKPRNPADRPAALPEIGRENLQEKILDIKDKTPISCDSRGGIDCGAGSDRDGSVICTDGYRNAELRFLLHCSKAALKVDRFELADSEGNGIANLKEPKSLMNRAFRAASTLELTIRNTSKIDASKVDVTFYFPEIHQAFEASGPDVIDSYGVADYTLPLSVLSNAFKRWPSFKARYKVYCSNCDTAASGANY